MIVGHVKDVEREAVRGDTRGAQIQWLLAQKQGVPHFHMRYVTVEPEGTIPLHAHEWIHQMFVVKGRGVLLAEDDETPIEAGSFVYMPSQKPHGMKNTGSSNLELVCCINAPAGG
jgi:quercetin dioxygenase-like cupin family protein